MLKRRREKQQQMEIVIMEQMVPEDHLSLIHICRFLGA